MDPFRHLLSLVDEMQRAVDAGFCYLALQMALALPDICGSLEEPPAGHPGIGVEDRYAGWCERYLEPKYMSRVGDRMHLWLSGLDCFYMRGGVVHQATLAGRSGGKKSDPARLKHVLFRVPDPNYRHSSHLMEEQDADGRSYLQFDLRRFCGDVADGVREWCGDKGRDALVLGRLDQLVRYRTVEFMGLEFTAIA